MLGKKLKFHPLPYVKSHHRCRHPPTSFACPRQAGKGQKIVLSTIQWNIVFTGKEKKPWTIPENIPEDSRPSKNQPFYHLLAENDQSYYVAYVSEQNLIPDETGEPVGHPDLSDLFGDFEDGRYPLQFQMN